MYFGMPGCPVCEYCFPADLEDAAIKAHKSKHSADEYAVVVARLKNEVEKVKRKADEDISRAQEQVDKAEAWVK